MRLVALSLAAALVATPALANEARVEARGERIAGRGVGGDCGCVVKRPRLAAIAIGDLLLVIGYCICLWRLVIARPASR